MAEVGPPPKRLRLSLACDECRRRKVKCDAQYPQCRNCRVRNGECRTTDPKRPGAVVAREWIEATDKTQQGSTATAALSTVAIEDSGSNAELANESRQETPRAPGTNELQPNEADHISPVHQIYDMTFHREHGTYRMKMQGGSSSQCLAKSMDLYFKSAGLKPLSSIYRYGMQHTEEMPMRLVLTLEPFPERPIRERYMEVYFSRIHMLFPLFDIDDMKLNVHQFATITDLTSLPHSQIPWLASAYLIMGIGADEAARHPTADGNKYLYAASNLLTHVVMHPYLPAVQALCLMAICFRSRNKDGIAWQVLGMAIRIAHTLGLQKHSSVRPFSEHVVQLRGERLFHARIWGVCCVLEKFMQLECGRPSAIGAINLDQMMSSDQRPPAHIQDFLQWSMRLAEVQEQIINHIYGHRPGERSAREILTDIARIDQALLAWTDTVPPEFRPGTDLFCRNEDFHYAVYLSLSYHSSVIALHRAALIAPSQRFQAEVNKECTDPKAQMRLQKGESICINSARSIAKLSIEVLDRKTHSRVLHTGPSLLACIVLAISLVKHPDSRLRATDLELLKACVEYTKDHFLASGQNPAFAQGVTAIYDEVRSFMQRGAQRNLKRPRSSANKTNSPAKAQQDANGSVNEHRPLSAPPPYQDITDTGHLMHFNTSGRDNQSFNVQPANEPDGSLRIPQWVGKPPAAFPAVQDADQAESYENDQFAPADFYDLNAVDGLSPNLLLQPESVPFASYNVEELLNWMLFMDTTDGNSAEDVSSYQSC